MAIIQRVLRTGETVEFEQSEQTLVRYNPALLPSVYAHPAVFSSFAVTLYHTDWVQRWGESVVVKEWRKD